MTTIISKRGREAHDDSEECLTAMRDIIEHLDMVINTARIELSTVLRDISRGMSMGGLDALTAVNIENQIYNVTHRLTSTKQP